MACRLFGFETDGADESVAVLGATVVEVEHVQHAVTVERVVQTIDRGMHRIFGVAEVDAPQVVGDLADDIEFGCVVLHEVGLPGAGAVRVVVVDRQRRRDASRDVDLHVVSFAVARPTSRPRG